MIRSYCNSLERIETTKTSYKYVAFINYMVKTLGGSWAVGV